MLPRPKDILQDYSTIGHAYLKVMKLNFLTILDLLFPPTEDELHIRNVSPDAFLKKYDHRSFNNIQHLSSFKDQEIRSAIHLAKFHKSTHAINLLSELCKKYLSQEEGNFLILPIPLSQGRLRARGYNQAAEIMRPACPKDGRHTLNETVLLRSRDTKPQTTLRKDERLKNMSNCFTAGSDAGLIHGKDVLLFDDVVTTGATLEAAKQAVSRHDPKSITCLALAH